MKHLTIDSDRAWDLAHDIARRDGVSVTEAVLCALEHEAAEGVAEEAPGDSTPVATGSPAFAGRDPRWSGFDAAAVSYRKMAPFGGMTRAATSC